MKQKHAVLATLFVFFMMSMISIQMVFADTTSLSVPNEQFILIPNLSHSSLQIAEVLAVNNNSFHPGDIHIPLPAGFENLHISGKPVSAKGIKLNMVTIFGGAKPQTTTEIMVSYSVKFSNVAGVQLNLRSAYPVDLAQIYLPVSSNSALSAQGVLASTKTVSLDGETFRVFTRPGLFENTDWLVGLQVLPDGNASSFTKGLTVIGEVGTGNIIESIANVALIVVALWMIVFRTRNVK